jgi:Uma2 family endonuclease
MFQRKEEPQPFFPHHGKEMTEQEFEALAAQPDVRYEYVHGRAYVLEPETENHNRLLFCVANLIDLNLVDTFCRVGIVDKYAQVAEKHRLLPDVAVTCDHNDKMNLILAPRVVVEVLSPYTERIDRGEKFAAYTHLPSLQEYVLVHQDQQQIELFRRTNNWQPRFFGPGERVELSSLKISFPVNEVYAALTP